MAAFPQSLCCFLAFFIVVDTFCTSTHAYVIDVGGSKGWTLHPTEDYKTWANRMRFSVHDILHFKYNKAIDSVLEVSKDDYESCNPNNPITKLDDGTSAFTLDASGPFYFITGNKTHCEKGQKLHLIVLTVRNGTQPPAAAASSPPPPPPSTPDSPSAPITVSTAPGASISIMSPPPMTSTTTADFNAPPPAEPSSAIPALDAASTVSFVIFMLALVGLIG